MTDTANKITNYYKLLGIDPKANQQIVKQAYLAAIKAWHPDKNPDRNEEAEEKTKALNQAYQILKDPETRKNYDRMLRYTKGKDFNAYINDEAIKDKITKAYLCGCFIRFLRTP
jgi:curved DNA-binding protein CbpA